MAITAEDARRELARRELARREGSKKEFSQGFFKTYEGQPDTLPKKLDVAAGGVANFAMNALNAPFEMAAEAIAAPLENRAANAPTVLGGNPKESNPVAIANKLIRAGAGAISGLPSGTPLESARAAYHADRGTLGTVEDVAGSLLMGRVAPQLATAPLDAAVKGIQAVAKGAGKASRYAGAKAMRVGLGPSEEAISTRLARPGAVKGARPFDELADEFAGTMNNLAKKVDDIDNEAWDSLLKLKAEPRSKIIKVLKDVRLEFKGTGKSKIGDADRGAVAAIDKYIERVQGIRQPGVDPKMDQMLDQRQLREIVQSVRRDAIFGGIQDTPTNLAAKKIQGKLDSLLKENGNYAEIMERLAPATRALKEASRKFRLERVPGQGFVPSDTTASKLSTFKEAKKPDTSKLLDSVKRETGVDFKDKVKLANYRAEFEPGERSRGSARTVAGSLLGLALEPFIPGPQGVSTFVGGAAGRSADYYGGAVAGKLIDAISRSGTKTGELLSAMGTGAKRSNLDTLLEMIRRQSPVISSAYQSGQ